VTIAAKYARYSKIWFSEDVTLFDEMFAIAKWALTAVATTRREAEMLAAIVYADATDSAGDLLEQPTAA
jgi:hypothetical protein